MNNENDRKLANKTYLALAAACAISTGSVIMIVETDGAKTKSAKSAWPVWKCFIIGDCYIERSYI